MTRPDDEDEDLRRAFVALRREDEKLAPSLEALLGKVAVRGEPRRVSGRLLAAAAALFAAVATGVALHRSPTHPPAVAPIGQWTAPTDFLLRTPGSEMLETVPRIGTPFEGLSVQEPRSESP